MSATREDSITVRLARSEERSTAAALIPAGTARGRASLALLEMGQGLLWIAREAAGHEEQLVGLLLATVQVQPETLDVAGYIQELLVHPDYRRRGVAMHLLDAAERYFFAEREVAQVFLVTSPDNDAALQLYRSRGYLARQVTLVKARPDALPRRAP